MLVTGTVVSRTTGQPISNASVVLVNQYGQYMNVGTQTNSLGLFSISSENIADPNALVFSAAGAGFQPVTVDAVILDGSPLRISLDEQPGLPPVTITLKPNKNFWILIAVGAFILLSSNKK